MGVVWWGGGIMRLGLVAAAAGEKEVKRYGPRLATTVC